MVITNDPWIGTGHVYDINVVKSVISPRDGQRAFSRVLFTKSHDEVATASGKCRLPKWVSPASGEDKRAQKRSILAAALMSTAPSIPVSFMGLEFLDTYGWSTPRKWIENSWIASAAFTRFIATSSYAPQLATNTAGLFGDRVNDFHVNRDDKLIAFHRWCGGGPGDHVVAVANLSSSEAEAHAVGFRVPGLWHFRFYGDRRGYSGQLDGHSISDLQSESGRRDGPPVYGAASISPHPVVVQSYPLSCPTRQCFHRRNCKGVQL